MGVSVVLDRFQRRHPAAGFPLAVVYKYVDDSGGYLAALIAYYGFVSLFPLLLLASTVLGFVLSGHPHLQQQILGSALHQFPVVGKQLGDPKHLGGGAVGLIVGILGSLYGALGVAQALQYAMNQAWRVPRNERPNPIKARGRSLVLLAAGGLAVLGTTVLSTLGIGGAGQFGAALRVAVLVASVVVNAGAFLLAFRVATARDVSVADIAPGAIGAAIGWQLLQTFGVVYVSHVVRHASATNGVFAAVLGLIAFLYLTAVMVVFCVEVNVVRVDDLHPRALLTPFTDNVSLTAGDRQAYTDQATAQTSKSFQNVDVDFDREQDVARGRPADTDDDQHGSAGPK
jgi:membrane protein